MHAGLRRAARGRARTRAAALHAGDGHRVGGVVCGRVFQIIHQEKKKLSKTLFCRSGKEIKKIRSQVTKFMAESTQTMSSCLVWFLDLDLDLNCGVTL